MKKLLAIMLFIFITAGCTSCGNGSAKNVAVFGLVAGKPSVCGDVFDFKKPDQSKTGPVIVGATRQVSPGDSITVTGNGLSVAGLKAYVYAQSTDNDGKAYECEFSVADDNQIVISLDKKIKYGIYGLYVKDGKNTSNTLFVNNPKIWWISTCEVKAGDMVSVYGENLTNENSDKSNIFLFDGEKHCAAEITYADPHKVTFKIPSFLEKDREYSVYLHSGHGGEIGWATADQKIKFVDKKTAEFTGGKTVNVTDFGADPKDEENDDSSAVQNAINSANDGDIIYFPSGVYKIENQIKIEKSLYIKGENPENTVLNMGNDVSEGMFNVLVGPAEFSGLNFNYVLGGGKLKVPFIRFSGDSYQSSYINLYVHNNMFRQATSAAARSVCPAIKTSSVTGVLIERNDFMVTQLLFTNGCKKVTVRENNCYGTCYVGPYYDQNFFLVWNTDGLDVSNNYMASADIINDPLNVLETGDYALGRAFSIQQKNYNIYIANNEIDDAGLPNDNAGEQIMLEQMTVLYEGNPKSAAGDSITMADDFNIQPSKNDVLTVINGKGLSQYRYISSFSGKNLKVSEPFAIEPDSNSRVILTRCFANVAIYNNSISGFKNYRKEFTATTGVQAYGGINNMFIEKNTFKDMSSGICISTHYRYNNSSSETNGIFWTVISQNHIQNCGVGILINLSAVPNQRNGIAPVKLLMGLNVRNNKITNIHDYEYERYKGIGGWGISVGTRLKEGADKSVLWQGEWSWGTVIENNLIESSDNGNIYLYPHQSKTFLKNNTVKGEKTEPYRIFEDSSAPIIIGDNN